ncbi:MAG: hypothetical protein LBE34_13685 [Flavobacteriaceae bacterium]|jgi:hypothetical protein|nr:hypothetical protein [Flavobacteriaceae bacterium]
MNIISKFTIASEEGLQVLFSLRKKQIIAKYQDIVSENILNQYIAQQLDVKEAILELNDLSTQMLTVFVNDTPAGYVIIKQVPSPELLKQHKVINYSSFYFSPEYNTLEVRTSLWNKCLTLTRAYEALWIEVLQSDPLIPYLQECGFKVETQTVTPPFNQPSFIMVRWKQENE